MYTHCCKYLAVLDATHYSKQRGTTKDCVTHILHKIHPRLCQIVVPIAWVEQTKPCLWFRLCLHLGNELVAPHIFTHASQHNSRNCPPSWSAIPLPNAQVYQHAQVYQDTQVYQPLDSTPGLFSGVPIHVLYLLRSMSCFSPSTVRSAAQVQLAWYCLSKYRLIWYAGQGIV